MKESLPVNIIEEQWDYLIVLDACRYDYFERLWKEYLPQGKLSCKWSPGSCTDEWRNKTFPGFYEDIVYISANPHFCVDQEVSGYCAGGHFHKVFEVWKSDWSHNIDSVSPERLTNVALDIIHNSEIKDKRYIIHYLQPHAPYFYFKSDYDRYPEKIDSTQMLLKIKKVLFRFFFNLLKHTKILGNKPDWILRKYLKLPPKAPMEYTLRNHSAEDLKMAYEENLKLVLAEIARLLQYISGRIIITSDHGELLGENRNYSHPNNSNDPILRRVPWLEIEKKHIELDHSKCSKALKNRNTTSGNLSDKIIVERLRSLGYYD